MSLTRLGRSTTILRDLLAEAQTQYIEREGAETVIYHSTPQGRWQRRASRIAREISTVVLDPVQNNALVEDIRDYLHQLTHQWYRNRGIPYRRGYVLYGDQEQARHPFALLWLGCSHSLSTSRA